MELEVQQLSLFDYASLDTDTRLFVQEKAQAIHTRLKRTAEDIIAIGQDLLEVKARLQHGQFGRWLQAEFDMTDRHALNFMRVASRFGSKSEIISDLPVTVIYELAAPSTPDTVIEMVEAGQITATLPAIREAKRELQQQEQRTSLTPAEVQALEPQPGPLYGAVYQSPAPAYTPPTHYAPPALSMIVTKLVDEDTDDEEEEYEETEEDRFETAAATGTQDYYYADLRREAMLRDEEEREKRRGAPAALQMSESNEWYTPAQYVEAARALMGGIDIDPASNALANETIQATTYYDIETNGLDKDWAGRVWLNPPYGREGGDSNQEIWSHRLIEQFQSGITTEALLLVNANTEAKWFQPLYDYLICFTNHRIRFYNTEGTSSQPTQGNALIYFGPQKTRFTELFKQFGPIVRRIA